MKLVVRFSSDTTLTSWLIRARTWSKYSHVDFVLPSGEYLGAIPEGGVCFHMEEYQSQDFFYIEVTEEQYMTIINYALSQVGKEYDYPGVLGFAAGRNWQSEDKWFCSEFIAASIQQVLPLFNEEPSKISPRDLAIINPFKRV